MPNVDIVLPPEVLEEARRIARPLEILDILLEPSEFYDGEPNLLGVIVIGEDVKYDPGLFGNLKKAKGYLVHYFVNKYDLFPVFFLRTRSTVNDLITQQ